jgi:predicted Ser/Thr protein kinase
MTFYAVKIVVRQAKNKICETMMLESQVLYQLKGEVGFPRLYYYIQDAATSYLVQSLLGKVGESKLKLFLRRQSL